MKRFYTSVDLAPVDGGIAVRLDGRQVKTPSKRALCVPTEGMADAIAAEWRAQGDEVDILSMRLTRLANTAIDRVADRRDAVVDEIARYAETDLVCYRTAMPAALSDRQKELWDPLLDWLRGRYGATLTVTDAVLPLDQPPASLEALRAAVSAFDHFSLSGLHSVTVACGSVVIGLAVAEGRVGGDDAWAASLVDESYQIEQWGEEAEAAKRRALLRQDIAAAARFLALGRRAA
ncbi:MAG: ATP12 family protein [Rhodospirillaceae bacterium]